jgi:radical SAM superfamily enzyme YgiQ (UPF0313 family)
MDLNTQEFSEEDWQWADLVCVGGMCSQQVGILEVIEKAKRTGKFVVVGGADPTSQPEVYAKADALVLGEAEASIPLWLESWRRGVPEGIFQSEVKPDVTKSPIPRYDLMHLDHYAEIRLQYARGCPFTCEFCDIIETFGRIPRTKTPEQMVAELEYVHRLGYRGHIDFVDDNFIGNKGNVKKMLPVLAHWNQTHGYPFSFSTEVSINLGDDRELLRLMQEANFRYVFTGIETPDFELLRMTQKVQNTTRPIVERINTIYEYGLIVSAGFIMGFDNEKPGMDRKIIRCVEETGICKAMVSLLVALPNTQLRNRLLKEGRLLVSESKRYDTIQSYDMGSEATAALNFVPTRSKEEILLEYRNVIRTIFEPRKYMDRVMRTAKKLPRRPRHLPTGRYGVWSALRMFVLVSIRMTSNPATGLLYWRNVILSLLLGLGRFEYAMRQMVLYLHFQKQTKLLLMALDRSLSELARKDPPGEA